MARMMLTQSLSGLSVFSCHSFQSIPKISSLKIYKFQLSSSHKSTCSSTLTETKMSKERKLPIFLFDIMDTIVRDPFYEDIPAFFGLSMKELLKVKHPTAWIEFEKGIITEEELAAKFFRDGRIFDFDGLKQCMRNGYAYLDGIECILHQLKSNGYEIHAFTNYPCWYMMIEEKLKLSTYLSWTFSSCNTGLLMWKLQERLVWMLSFLRMLLSLSKVLYFLEFK
ncbi:flavin mononucleotide hydrolase 1, chloroplatic isoform X2 [Cryptomeria japonica]|uniref:flavin mononucleotide hydrolase 1, chloroplatic isoform X2 n=1 Tax=Cryptomeria japonica TaxID=3369 RepID=UPI0027D9D183|nr:flavin mononucleotide hydrolase 1, chloroplatic isoform X2 [Cryptomeria japonica]